MDSRLVEHVDSLINNKLDMIIEMLKKMDVRIAAIEDNISRIDENSVSVEKDCAKMRDHIVFIENTYEIVRSPLNYIKSRIEYVMGNKEKELPSLGYYRKDTDFIGEEDDTQEI